MMHALVLLSAVALAPDPFEAVRQKATEVDSTTRLLEAYGANCDQATDPVEAQECQERHKKVANGYKGKDLYLHLGSDLEGKVEVADVGGGRATLVLTPVFDLGAGVALTFTKPVKLDGQGTIIVNRQPVEGALLDDTMMAADLKRLAKTGTLTLEVVGTIKGPWQLKKKDGSLVRGVEMKVTAIRFGNKRGGKPVLSSVK
jgi:hypothetical protein